MPGAGAPRRLNLAAGDAYLADPRALHRGTANTADAPRPEIVICYTAARPAAAAAQAHACFQEGGITRDEYAALRLSARGERLLGHGRPRL